MIVLKKLQQVICMTLKTIIVKVNKFNNLKVMIESVKTFTLYDNQILCF